MYGRADRQVNDGITLEQMAESSTRAVRALTDRQIDIQTDTVTLLRMCRGLIINPRRIRRRVTVVVLCVYV